MRNVLPLSGYIREAELIPAIVPISHATLWRWSKNGTFPAPVRLSARVSRNCLGKKGGYGMARIEKS